MGSPSPWSNGSSVAAPAAGSVSLVPSTGTSANASLLNGYVQSAAATANTIALRDSAGGLTVAALSATSGTFSAPVAISNGDQSGARVSITNSGTGGQAWAMVAGKVNTGNVGFDLWCTTTGTHALYLDGAGNGTFAGALSATTGTFSEVFVVYADQSIARLNVANTASGGQSWSIAAGYVSIGQVGLDIWCNTTGCHNLYLDGNGNGTFAAGVTATTGTFTTAVYLPTSGAPSPTTNALYQVSSNPYWNGYEILTMGNLNNTAAALMATQAQVLAPQWVASLPSLPNAQYPAAFWDATNSIYQGGYVCIISTKAMYQNQGGSWVSVGVSQGIFGKITAGAISAASIGATALVTQLALVSQYISSQSFNSGGLANTTPATTWGVPAYSGQYGLPVGWAIYSQAISSWCYNGDTTVTTALPAGTTGVGQSASVIAEIGGNVSLNGYLLSGLSLSKIVNAGTLTFGSSSWTAMGISYTPPAAGGSTVITWVCPPGITQVEVTVGSGGGGSAWYSATYSGCGGGGAAIVAVLTVVPFTSYTITVGGGGISVTGAGTAGTGGTSSFVGGTCNISATGGAGGQAGSGSMSGGAGGSAKWASVTVATGGPTLTSGSGTAISAVAGVNFRAACGGASGGTQTLACGTTPGYTASSVAGGPSPLAAASVNAGTAYGGGAGVNTSANIGAQGVVILRW